MHYSYFPILILLSVPCLLQAQTADFSITKRQGCSPLDAVNFTDLSTGGTVTGRIWDLGKGVISNTSATVGNNYEMPGTYYINLTVTFSNGEVRTKKDSIIVHPDPVAAFTASDTAGCATHTVRLTDLSTTSTGTVTGWSWDIGPGNSQQQHPVYSLTANGDYDVKLLVTNSWGCKSGLAVKKDYIHVYDKVKAAFSIPLNYSCDTPFTVQLLNRSTGGGTISYRWLFGDGDSSAEASPAHTYKHTGIYTVKLTAKNGTACADEYTIAGAVWAGKPSTIIQAVDTACAYTPVVFSTTVAPPSFLPALNWKWLFPDGQVLYGRQVSLSFTRPGTFDVWLITYANNACADTAHHAITIREGPQPAFTPDKSTACNTPFTVNFLNETAPRAGMAYSWDFGDGSAPVSLPDPSHTYIRPGLYTVTLQATDTTMAGGCSTVSRKVDAIRITRLKVDLVCLPPEGCTPLPVTATAKLANLVDSVLQYSWDFGEGASLTTSVSSAVHTYATAGNYLVKLTIVTQSGCTDSSTIKTVKVNALCTDDGSGGNGGGGGGGFVTGRTCADKRTVTFTDTTSHAVVISWDFGDGTPLYTSPPLNSVTHRFADTGSRYIVTVTRQDTLSGKQSVVQKQLVLIDEKAGFYPDITAICKDKKVSFVTQGIDSSHIGLYTWDFGDSTAKTVVDNNAYFRLNGSFINGNTSHVYTDAGEYFVKLSIRDKLGCPDSFVYAIPVVVKGPQARFAALQKTSCGSQVGIDFTDSSIQNGTVPIREWLWNFGNGVQQTLAAGDTSLHQVYTNQYAYQEYTAMLTVTDSLGCRNTASQLIKSYRPKADFTSADTLTCGKPQVMLYNSSAAYQPVYTWYYGDGTSAATIHGSHAYKEDGAYDVKLVVQDVNGCRDSLTRPGFIKLVRPRAFFSVGDTSQCGPTAVRFSDSSLYAYSYTWDFGDYSSGSADKAPSHLYNPGIYPVRLRIKGVSGCTDSVTKIIRVKGPVGILTTGYDTACAPYNYPMAVKGSFITAYAWDFGDGTPVNRSQDSTVYHVYRNGGKFSPNVVLTSVEGCSFLLRARPLLVDAVKAGFTVDKNRFCDSGWVQFANRSSTSSLSPLRYTWHFGNGSPDGLSAAPLHRYAAPGSYNAWLVAETASGCKDSFALQEPVVVYRHPVVDIAGEVEGCAGLSVPFTAKVSSGDSIIHYTWKLNGNTVGSSNAFAHVFTSAGSYNLTAGVSSRYGCEAVATKNILIHSLPRPVVSADTAICSGSRVQLHASGGTRYNWWPVTDLQDAGQADPLATPRKNTRYYVSVTSAFGCSQTDSVFVRVDNKVALQYSKDALICQGEKLRLTASGYTQQYVWNPAESLSNPAIANPLAFPQQTTLYRVIGYSTNVCPNDTGFVRVTVASLPVVDLGPDLTVDAGSRVLLQPRTGNNIDRYVWEPSAGLSCTTCPNPQLTADKDITYRLSVSTKEGCKASDEISLRVPCGKGAIRIPDAFTPNGDGKNDVFYIMGWGIQRIRRFSVYSRWGQLIFTKENFLPNDVNSGWNGLVNNQQVTNTTTFVYTAEIICNEGKPIPVKGTVILIR